MLLLEPNDDLGYLFASVGAVVWVELFTHYNMSFHALDAVSRKYGQ